MRTLGHSHSLTDGLLPKEMTQKILVWAEKPTLEEIIQEALQKLFGLFRLQAHHSSFSIQSCLSAQVLQGATLEAGGSFIFS